MVLLFMMTLANCKEYLFVESIQRQISLYLQQLQFEQTMEPQILINRISECIDDLGLLLDHIYKFPQKQREGYFDRIQTLKNKLLSLKSNVRQGHISVTEKQYKQLYLAMNTLKNDIMPCSVQSCSTKQNRQVNKYRQYKEVKKSQEQSLKVIGVRDQEINQLKNLVLEKQQLIKLNYEEISCLKLENQNLLENKRMLNYEHHDYEIELERTKALLLRAESDVMDLKIRQQEKDKAFNSAIAELESLKRELIQANERIISLQDHAEANFKKTKLAEETIRKAEKEAEARGDSILIKESDHFKQVKAISELQFEVTVRNDSIKQLEQQTKHLKQDIEVLENEIGKVQAINKVQKEQFNRERQGILCEQKRLQSEIEASKMRQGEFRKMLEEGDKKYHVVINKLNSAEEFKVKLRQSEFQTELLTEKVCNLEVYVEKYQNQIKLLTKEKEKLQIKLEKEEAMTRQIQVENFKLSQKLKLKQEELEQMFSDLQRFKSRMREYERQLSIRERKEKSIESNLMQQKTRLIKLQQKQKVRNKQIEGLKIKLVRAKLETIHQLRQTIQ